MSLDFLQKRFGFFSDQSNLFEVYFTRFTKFIKDQTRKCGLVLLRLAFKLGDFMWILCQIHFQFTLVYTGFIQEIGLVFHFKLSRDHKSIQNKIKGYTLRFNQVSIQFLLINLGIGHGISFDLCLTSRPFGLGIKGVSLQIRSSIQVQFMCYIGF